MLNFYRLLIMLLFQLEIRYRFSIALCKLNVYVKRNSYSPCDYKFLFEVMSKNLIYETLVNLFSKSIMFCSLCSV